MKEDMTVQRRGDKQPFISTLGKTIVRQRETRFRGVIEGNGCSIQRRLGFILVTRLYSRSTFAIDPPLPKGKSQFLTQTHLIAKLLFV